MATQFPTEEEYLKELKRLKSEGNFDELLYTAGTATSHYPESVKLLNLLHYAQEHYVEAKLDSQIVSQLEAKGNYESLAAVYMKLLTVLPDSNRLKKRLDEARIKIQTKQSDAVQEFYAQAEIQIKKMLNDKDFENAARACREILVQDSEKTNFIALLAKAEDGIEKKTDALLEKYYKEAIPELFMEYEKNKENFARI